MRDARYPGEAKASPGQVKFMIQLGMSPEVAAQLTAGQAKDVIDGKLTQQRESQKPRKPQHAQEKTQDNP